MLIKHVCSIEMKLVLLSYFVVRSWNGDLLLQNGGLSWVQEESPPCLVITLFFTLPNKCNNISDSTNTNSCHIIHGQQQESLLNQVPLWFYKQHTTVNHDTGKSLPLWWDWTGCSEEFVNVKRKNIVNKWIMLFVDMILL